MKKIIQLYNNKTIVVLASVLCTTIVLILCLIPSQKLQNINAPISDKWAHFLAFGTMSIGWLSSFKKITSKHYPLIIILGCLYGLIIELLQISPITYGRSFEWLDIVADGIGTTIGCIIFYCMHRWFIKPSLSHHQQQSDDPQS